MENEVNLISPGKTLFLNNTALFFSGMFLVVFFFLNCWSAPTNIKTSRKHAVLTKSVGHASKTDPSKEIKGLISSISVKMHFVCQFNKETVKCEKLETSRFVR